MIVMCEVVLSGFALQKPLGTLRVFEEHGVGNPRDFGSGRCSSLLKFKVEIERILKKQRHRYRNGNGDLCEVNS